MTMITMRARHTKMAIRKLVFIPRATTACTNSSSHPGVKFSPSAGDPRS